MLPVSRHPFRVLSRETLQKKSKKKSRRGKEHWITAAVGYSPENFPRSSGHCIALVNRAFSSAFPESRAICSTCEISGFGERIRSRNDSIAKAISIDVRLEQIGALPTIDIQLKRSLISQEYPVLSIDIA